MTTLKRTMPVSAEEKALRKEAKAKIAEAEKAARELEAAAELAAYKAGLPQRLVEAKEKAEKLGVRVEIDLTHEGPVVSFYADDPECSIEDTLTYNSNSWEVEYLEGRLCRLQARQDLQRQRMETARSAWATLSDDQKSCLREYFAYMN